MDLTKISLQEFLGNVTQSFETTMPASGIISAYEFDFECVYPVLCKCNDFNVVQLNIGHSDVGLCYEDKLIGIYKGEHLFIDYPADYIGPKELSAPMILLAVQNRVVPTERNLTVAGEKALIKAWHVANGLATGPWWPCSP